MNKQLPNNRKVDRNEYFWLLFAKTTIGLFATFFIADECLSRFLWMKIKPITQKQFETSLFIFADKYF
jgi:hypothetical protein